MKSLPPPDQLSPRDRIELCEKHGGGYRAFLIFLIACALLVAGFAISAVWMQAERPLPSDEGEASLGLGAGESADSNTESEAETSEDTEPIPEEIPNGADLIREMDLAALWLGEGYIHNETAYRPSVAELLEREFAFGTPDSPTVLILHTHSSEAYLAEGISYITEPMGDLSYSEDEERNVIAVGRVLCDALEKNGITVLHCTVMHDDPTLRGSYERAAETIRLYLKEHPEISCVIDLHRDSVRDGEGAYVRSFASGTEEPTAQVLCVVGTDGNGTPCEQWEKNLALALQLRRALNAEGASLCRPVSLRNSSFNQELAPASILLEVGCDANTLAEAKRAAALVGEALAGLLLSE